MKKQFYFGLLFDLLYTTDHFLIVTNSLSQYFVFQFVQLLFPKISEQLKGSQIHVFDVSSNNFWKHPLHFFASLVNNLIYPLYSHVVYYLGCVFYDAWRNFFHLVDGLFISIGKIIPVQNATSIVFFFYIFGEVCFFFICISYLILILAFVSSPKNHSMSLSRYFSLQISMFRIPVQVVCSPQKIASISSALNF